MKQEHCGNGTVRQSMGLDGAVVVLNILGQAADDEQQRDEQRLRKERSGLSAPGRKKSCTEQRACETPNVHYDILVCQTFYSHRRARGSILTAFN